MDGDRGARATPRCRCGSPITTLGRAAPAGDRPRSARATCARAEDPVDAVVCAYVALYAQRCPAGVTVYGDFATRVHRDAVAAAEPGRARVMRPGQIAPAVGRWVPSTSMMSITVRMREVRGSRPSTKRGNHRTVDRADQRARRARYARSGRIARWPRRRPRPAAASCGAWFRATRAGGYRRCAARIAISAVRRVAGSDTSPTSRSTSTSAVVSGPRRRRDRALTRARSCATSIIPMCSTARAIKSSRDEK